MSYLCPCVLWLLVGIALSFVRLVGRLGGSWVVGSLASACFAPASLYLLYGVVCAVQPRLSAIDWRC